MTNGVALPVLSVEGETLLGGWQDRTLNVSIILAAGATTAVPVSCVERGRWGSGREGAKPAPTLAPKALRACKQRAVAAGVLGGSLGRHTDQGEVWRAVDEYTARFAVAAPTAALGNVQRARRGDVEAASPAPDPFRASAAWPPTPKGWNPRHPLPWPSHMAAIITCLAFYRSF